MSGRRAKDELPIAARRGEENGVLNPISKRISFETNKNGLATYVRRDRFYLTKRQWRCLLHSSEINGFNNSSNSGMLLVAATQMRSTKISPYSCASTLRWPMIRAQGISGCSFRN